MVAIGETVGLAEWIIDDTCLVNSSSDILRMSVTTNHSYIFVLSNKLQNG